PLGPIEVDFDSKLLILNNGYSVALADMLKRQGETFNLRDPRGDLSLFTKYPVLLIPSGGLIGLNAPSFRQKLLDYVSQGGTIICLAQQYGDDYQALPGNLSGYGWREDQSCWSNAVYIQNPHPIFSGQTKVSLDANCDGYFNKWPETSTILLNRTKNGMPAMLSYPIGSGTVIVSSLYSDWGYAKNHVSGAEKILIRDLITWLKSDREIEEVEPGESISLEFRVKSLELEADEARIKVYDPNKQLLYTQHYTLNTGTIAFTFQTYATSTLGIYTVTSETQGTETSIFWFGVKRELGIISSKEITFSVQSAYENYVYGNKGVFTIPIWNKTDVDREITYYYYFPHNYWATG
ncbi:MAG: hypothetical protein AAB267_07120, partial [Candidatus Desantisbacteria bacterium]